MAGAAGFEPAHAGIKIPCLNQLGDAPVLISLSVACVTGNLQASLARLTALPFAAAKMQSAVIDPGDPPSDGGLRTSHPWLAGGSSDAQGRCGPPSWRPRASSKGETATPVATWAVNSGGQRAAMACACSSVRSSRNTQPPLPESLAAPWRPSQSSAAATPGWRSRTTGVKAFSVVSPETKDEIVAGGAFRVNSGA